MIHLTAPCRCGYKISIWLSGLGVLRYWGCSRVCMVWVLCLSGSEYWAPSKIHVSQFQLSEKKSALLMSGIFDQTINYLVRGDWTQHRPRSSAPSLLRCCHNLSCSYRAIDVWLVWLMSYIIFIEYIKSCWYSNFYYFIPTYYNSCYKCIFYKELLFYVVFLFIYFKYFFLLILRLGAQCSKDHKEKVLDRSEILWLN